MQLVFNNPYRVLGLPATATARDVAKRISDLETFAELGKVKSYPHDFPCFGAVDRSLEAVKDAARKIEQPEGRLLHSFFWFRAGDSVDELAMDGLASGNVDQASEIWTKQLSRDGVKRYTWVLNRGLIHLIKAVSSGLNIEELNRSLKDIGLVVSAYLDDSIRDVLVGGEAGVNRDSLLRRLVDEIIAIAQLDADSPYGKGGIGMISAFSSFPSPARDYASAKLVNPLIEEVNEAIKKSEALRAEDNLHELRLRNRLNRVEGIIKSLQEVLGSDDIRLQTVANAYADEVCSCAVKALNDFEDPKLASVLIQWAGTLPSFSRVKVRIAENAEAIQSWIRSAEEEKIFSEIVEKLQTKLHTIKQAGALLDEMKVVLAQIKAKTGPNNEQYIAASSACAHHILSFLIESVNAAQERFTNGGTFAGLQSTVSTATDVTKGLLSLDMDREATLRVKKNLEVIDGINATLTTAASARRNQSSSSRGLIEQIPGWLWVVGIILLISMCSGS